jgi:hypothetical protein
MTDATTPAPTERPGAGYCPDCGNIMIEYDNGDRGCYLCGSLFAAAGPATPRPSDS